MQRVRMHVCMCVYEYVSVFVKGRNLELTCDVL